MNALDPAGTPRGVLDIQAAALLERVTSDREQRCAALKKSAALKARQIVAAARTEALANLRKAIVEERARIEQGLRQAAARAEIEARNCEQRESQLLLQGMWLDIAAVIERRWSNPVQRQAWIEGAVALAGMLLAGRPWRIESGPSLTESERVKWTNAALDKGSGAVEWELSSSTHAGLSIRSDQVCIDATVPGLLVQRDAIESAFLAEYQQLDATRPLLDTAPLPLQAAQSRP